VRYYEVSMKNLLLAVLLGSSTYALADSPDSTDVAARLYRIKCAGCHGANGEGGIGASLKGKLRHRAQLFEVIKNGIPSTEMPASGLPDPQVKKMVAYVLYLNKRKP
jgi:mono/diheme cytochrome c family protein